MGTEFDKLLTIMRYRKTPHILYAAIAVTILGSLAACQVQTVDNDPFVVADLFEMPGRALATIDITATPPPSPTQPNEPTSTAAPTLPLPTVVVLSQPTLAIGTFGPSPTFQHLATQPVAPAACVVQPEMPFTPIWQNIEGVRASLGCPVGNLEVVDGAFQVYEHGMMFWRRADHSIFAISELNIRQGQPSDSWWRLDDTFQDGQPDSDPSLQPPAGLKQPVRGFGKVWRENAFIREALGWAVADEVSGTTQWQPFEKGWMMTGANGIAIYAMIPLDAPPYTTGFHSGPLP